MWWGSFTPRAMTATWQHSPQTRRTEWRPSSSRPLQNIDLVVWSASRPVLHLVDLDGCRADIDSMAGPDHIKGLWLITRGAAEPRFYSDANKSCTRPNTIAVRFPVVTEERLGAAGSGRRQHRERSHVRGCAGDFVGGGTSCRRRTFPPIVLIKWCNQRDGVFVAW